MTIKYTYTNYEDCNGWESETLELEKYTGMFPPDSWPSSKCPPLTKRVGKNRKILTRKPDAFY